MSALIFLLSIHFIGDIALSLIGTSSDRPLLFFKALAYGGLFVLFGHVSLVFLVLLLVMHILVDVATSESVAARYPTQLRGTQYSLTVNQVLKVLVLVVLFLLVH